jgi:hypothetical protein
MTHDETALEPGSGTGRRDVIVIVLAMAHVALLVQPPHQLDVDRPFFVDE